jgi:hypothetical protein
LGLVLELRSADKKGVGRKGLLLAVLIAAGLSTSFAFAERLGDVHGKGPGHEKATITRTATTTTTAAKVTLCHRTGSPSHPVVKIAVPPDAVWTHVKRGDELPGADGSCPIHKSKPKPRS